MTLSEILPKGHFKTTIHSMLHASEIGRYRRAVSFVNLPDSVFVLAYGSNAIWYALPSGTIITKLYANVMHH